MSSFTASAVPFLISHPIPITACVIVISCFIFKVLLSSPPHPSNVPKLVVKDDKTASNGHVAQVFPTLAAALRDAYPKFRDAAVLVTGKKSVVWADTVIIPPKWAEGLKNLPENQLSFTDAIADRFNSKLTYTFLADPRQNHAFIKSVSVDLTRHISKIMADLDDEINFAFGNLLPACDDWTEVYPGQVLPQIVALASGRIFVGKPLCRDPDFMKSTITFTIDSFMAGEALHKYPKILRPLIAPFLKQVKECWQQNVTMRRLLKSQLDERRAMLQAGEELPSDMMTWMINNSPDEYKFDLAHQASSQLGVSLAAIHTTTMTASHAWLDLTARPEYLEPLREEWNSVLATETDRVISKASMPKLKKLDSFLKESQRMNPLGPTSFERKVTSELSLPDGTKLPIGTYLAVPAQALGMDDSLWVNPETFDGFRFEKLRKQPGMESRYQFAATGIESMNFGHGKHACPGRFFAANEIKLILAYIIQNYEMKFPEGQGRPENIVGHSGTRPDYSKPILLKKRKV